MGHLETKINYSYVASHKIMGEHIHEVTINFHMTSSMIPDCILSLFNEWKILNWNQFYFFGFPHNWKSIIF